MNKVFLAGRLVREPKGTISSNGVPVSLNAIAVRSNNRNAVTQFVNFAAFQSSANFINSYLHKGDFIIIEGRLSIQKYVSSDGKNMSSINVIADSITPTPGNRFSNSNVSDYVSNTRKTDIKNEQEFVSIDSINPVKDDDMEVFEIPDDEVFKTSTFSIKKPESDVATNVNEQDNQIVDDENLSQRQDWEDDLED